MHLFKHPPDGFDAILQAFSQSSSAIQLESGLQVHFRHGEALPNFIVQLAGDIPPFRFLDMNEAMGKGLDFVTGALAFRFSRLKRLGHKIKSNSKPAQFVSTVRQSGAGAQVAAGQAGTGFHKSLDWAHYEEIAADPTQDHCEAASGSQPAEIDE